MGRAAPCAACLLSGSSCHYELQSICNHCISTRVICTRPEKLAPERDLSKVLASEAYFLIAAQEKGWKLDCWTTLVDLIGKIAHANGENAQAEVVELFLATLKATGDQPPHLLSILKTTPFQTLTTSATVIRTHLESGLKRLDQEFARQRQRAEQRKHNEPEAVTADGVLEIGHGKRRRS